MEFCNGFAGKEDLYIPYFGYLKDWDKNRLNDPGNKEKDTDKTDNFKEIEQFLYTLADGKYLLKDNRINTYYEIKKRTEKTKYEQEVPVVEIEALKDSMPLPRSHIPYGVRGYCFPATGQSYVHVDDVDTYRVNYHENLHIRIYRQSPNHPEWEIRMLEDWRLGKEKH